MRSHIAIIGAGNLGQALKKLLDKHEVHLWDKVADKVPNQKPLADVVTPSQVVFLAVPSSVVREVLQEIKPFLGKKAIVVTLAKGIEPGTLETIDQLLLNSLPKSQPCAHLSGPMLAAEIQKGKHAAAVVGAYSRSTFTKLKKIFSETPINLAYSRDMRGVAVAGVLKNIYTLPLGIAAGLELGNNTIGWLAYCALNEMQQVMPMLGGAKKTLLSVAGIGDFIATATSPLSMNYRAGSEIAKTGGPVTISEGLVALPSILTLLGPKVQKLPLLHALSQIVVHRHDARTTLTNLLV